MKAYEPLWSRHKEKALLLVAGALLASAVALPGAGRIEVPDARQRVAGSARTASLGRERSFILDDAAAYWPPRETRWIFVEEEILEVPEPVKLDLPEPYLPTPPWPLPTPGPLLRFTEHQPRLGQPLDTFEPPGGADEGDEEGPGGDQ